MYLRTYFICLPLAATIAAAFTPVTAPAAVHLWNIKEIFSNADGSVQFIELYDDFDFENATRFSVLRANSDGAVKDFQLNDNLSSTATAGRHILIATPGFADLPGGVAPNFTLPDPAVNGPFFNPNATTLIFTFTGSGDVLSFAGSLLPKDGFHSLTDANAVDFPQQTANLSVTVNSPTRFPNTTPAQIDLRPPAPPVTTGDYNGNGIVDAADYTVWRNTFGQEVDDGTGADGVPDGTIDEEDYDFWKSRFGNVVDSPGSGSAASVLVPEPAVLALTISGLWVLAFALCRRRECGSSP